MSQFHTDDADAVEWERELRGEHKMRGKRAGQTDESDEPELLANSGE